MVLTTTYPILLQSISRQHAVIQFRKNGAAYLFDLESSHGSYVNKKPSKPKGYTKIMPGDQIKFGQSTRTFILGGGEPPQDDSEEYMEKKEAAEQKKKQAAEQNKKQRQVLDKLPTQKKMSAEEVADAIRRARDDDDDADDLAPQYGSPFTALYQCDRQLDIHLRWHYWVFCVLFIVNSSQMIRKEMMLSSRRKGKLRRSSSRITMGQTRIMMMMTTMIEQNQTKRDPRDPRKRAVQSSKPTITTLCLPRHTR
jgi:pSer/pThr/pTyr-binding forkhead associated (FHA) protein